MSKDDVPSIAWLPTSRGEFKIEVFHEEETGFDHVALTLGNMQGPDPVLIRVHSECLTGDVFGSTRCDCGPQLHATLMPLLNEDGALCSIFAKKDEASACMLKFRHTIFRTLEPTPWMPT